MKQAQRSPLNRTALASFFKDAHKLTIMASNLRDRGLAGLLIFAPCNERIPEVSTANSKTNEARNRGRSGKPLAHLLLIFTASEDDAADRTADVALCNGHNFLAVFTAVESFYLP